MAKKAKKIAAKKTTPKRSPSPRASTLPSRPSLKVVGERRKLTRVLLATEQFRLDRTGKVFAVSDLSLGGMAITLIEGTDKTYFSLTETVSGILNLKREKYPIKAKIRNIRNDAIGCEFVDLKGDVKSAIEEFLDPKVLGRELRPLPFSEESTIWYHGPTGTDLLFKRAMDGGYREFSILILGQYIQWDAETGIATGTLKRQDSVETGGILKLDSVLLDRDFQLDPHKLKMAESLVGASELPEDLRSWCLRRLKNADRI